MIKFFRKIRQNLLSENRFSKYLFYAIGEIILVVIGILIALQINNWNEHKKTESKARQVLMALRSDLMQDVAIIEDRYPEVNHQYQLNESLRARLARTGATVDTLLAITRKEFNPNWNNPVVYNTNAYHGLQDQELIETLPDTLKSAIKAFYNSRLNQQGIIDKITITYQEKISRYVDRYTFGSTALHDQGPLIDSLVWAKADYGDVAAAFQGMSNFKRILFRLTKDEMEYSLEGSRQLIQHIDQYLKIND